MSKIDDPTRCTHTTADGRRCRMPRVDPHTELCGTHLEAQQRRMRSDPAARPCDALNGLTDLGSAVAVNHALRNLTNMVMDGRMDYRRAMVLGYLTQVLLQSISMAKHERWDDEIPPSRPR